MKPEFLTLVEQQYGVRPKALTGGSKDLADVNEWVAQQTGRKVQRFLTKNFARNPNPGVNAVSAAYFKGPQAPPQFVLPHRSPTARVDLTAVDIEAAKVK